jgi:hypothetical protein
MGINIVGLDFFLRGCLKGSLFQAFFFDFQWLLVNSSGNNGWLLSGVTKKTFTKLIDICNLLKIKDISKML